MCARTSIQRKAWVPHLLLISKTNSIQRRGRSFSATYSRSCKPCSMTLITQRPPRFPGHRPAVDVPFLGNQIWIDFIWRTARGLATLTPREVSQVHCCVYRGQGAFQHDYLIVDRAVALT